MKTWCQLSFGNHTLSSSRRCTPRSRPGSVCLPRFGGNSSLSRSSQWTSSVSWLTGWAAHLSTGCAAICSWSLSRNLNIRTEDQLCRSWQRRAAVVLWGWLASCASLKSQPIGPKLWVLREAPPFWLLAWRQGFLTYYLSFCLCPWFSGHCSRDYLSFPLWD